MRCPAPFRCSVLLVSLVLCPPQRAKHYCIKRHVIVRPALSLESAVLAQAQARHALVQQQLKTLFAECWAGVQVCTARRSQVSARSLHPDVLRCSFAMRFVRFWVCCTATDDGGSAGDAAGAGSRGRCRRVERTHGATGNFRSAASGTPRCRAADPVVAVWCCCLQGSHMDRLLSNDNPHKRSHVSLGSSQTALCVLDCSLSFRRAQVHVSSRTNEPVKSKMQVPLKPHSCRQFILLVAPAPPLQTDGFGAHVTWCFRGFWQLELESLQQQKIAQQRQAQKQQAALVQVC